MLTMSMQTGPWPRAFSHCQTLAIRGVRGGPAPLILSGITKQTQQFSTQTTD